MQKKQSKTSSKATDLAYLLVEPLDPTLQVLQLLGAEILTIIKWTIEILGQHLLIEALTRETSRSITAGEVLVRSAGSVEVASAGHVVDFSLHGQVHGLTVFAVIGQQGPWCEGSEDYGCWCIGDDRLGGWLESVVYEHRQDEEKKEVM